MTQSTETATTLREALNFVGGEWVASSGGATFDVADPFTGETVVRAAAGTRDDAHRDELLVNRLTEEIRERIQRMVVAALSERDSVFR